MAKKKRNNLRSPNANSKATSTKIAEPIEISKATATKTVSVEQPVAEGNNPKNGLKYCSYIVAFLLPAIILLIAYAIFKVYPFGEKSVLALDLNAQYVYYFEGLRDAIWGDGSIFYNWSRNLSGGYMGIIGYYLASPFTIIPMILPRTMILESLLIMILCKIASAGLTFNIYLQDRKKLSPLSAIIFSTLYALMAYGVIQTIDPMWLDGLVMLPLIVRGIERFIDNGKRVGYIVPLAIMFVSNFYIGYMIAIFTAIYYFCYLLLNSPTKLKSAKKYVNKTIDFGLCTAVVLMLSAFMILPVYKALSLGKFDFSGDPDYSFATQFSPIEIVACLFPNQYYSVNVHGRPEIYCGMATMALLPLFYLNKAIQPKKKIGYSIMIGVLLLSMYVRPIDMMWHGGQAPNWLPFRYSFILSFVLLSVAVESFTHIKELKKNIPSFAVSTGIICGLAYLSAITVDSFNYVKRDGLPYVDVKHTLVWGSIAVIVYSAIFLLYVMWKNKKATQITLMVLTLGLVSVETCYNAVDSFKKIDNEVAYSNRDTYYPFVNSGREVVSNLTAIDDGLYRADKTYFRCVNDALGFGLKGFSHSSSLMNAKVLSFLEAVGYTANTYESRYDGNTQLADSLLGVKYVIDDNSNSTLLNKRYNQIDTIAGTLSNNEPATFTIYENPTALNIGYMADRSILNLANLGNDDPFNSQNLFLSTMCGQTSFDDSGEFYEITDFNHYYNRIPIDYTYQDCDESDYDGQHCFTAYYTEGDTNRNIDPIVNIHFTPTSSKPVFMYLKTNNENEINLWFSKTLDENGNFTEHKSLAKGYYYGDFGYHIVEIDGLEPFQPVEVRLTILLNEDDPGLNEYVMVEDFEFYEFNQTLFEEDINKLKNNQFIVTEHDGNTVEGTITAGENQIMFTSIPYEDGWTIKVDGKKVEPICVLDTFIGLELSPGEHEIKMNYVSPGFKFGIFTLILGVGIVIILAQQDGIIKNKKLGKWIENTKSKIFE